MDSVQVIRHKEKEENIKTYSLVLKFKDQAQREIANSRIRILENRQSQLLHDKFAQQVSRDLARKNPFCSFPATKIQKQTKKSPNISFSAYNILFANSKESIDKEKKVSQLFDFLLKNPQQALEWAILGRSPYTECSLSRKWKADYVYVLNLLTSTRRQIDSFWRKHYSRQYLAKKLEFNGSLPHVSQKEVEHSIQDSYTNKIEEFAKMDELTKNQVDFLDKLQLLVQKKNVVAPYITSWINISQPARWKNLKKLSKQIADSIGQSDRKLNSALRLVIVFALFPYLWETVSQLIALTKPESVVSSPFEKRRKKNIPVKLLMKHEYDVTRPGNSETMTKLAREDGYFRLGFPSKGSIRIDGLLFFPEKVIEYLTKGAKIKILVIKSGKAPSYKPKVSAILAGEAHMFLSTKLTKKFAKQIKCSNSAVIGLDVNRVGVNMLAFSNGLYLNKILKLLSKRYLFLTNKEIPRICKALTIRSKQKDDIGYYKAKGELNRVYTRRANIIKEIRKIITHYIAAVIVKSKCKLFCVEDIKKSPRGKRGALAKAIYNMPYKTSIFEKATQIATHILGYEVALVYVNPRNTSKIHNNCGGTMQRSLKSYDYAVCDKCGIRINTHLNAARNIATKGEQKSKNIKLPLDAAKGTGKKIPSSKSTASAS